MSDERDDPPLVPTSIPGWRMPCLKCEVTSDWPCECPAPRELDDVAGVPSHRANCGPPERCPNQECRSLRWWEPPKWRRGEGTSRETIRRRKLERAAKRRSRAKT